LMDGLGLAVELVLKRSEVRSVLPPFEPKRDRAKENGVEKVKSLKNRMFSTEYLAIYFEGLFLLLNLSVLGQ